MKLRRLLTLALALAFVFVAPSVAKADETARGWVQDSKGWWYEYTDENGNLSYYKDDIYYIDIPETEDVYEAYYFNKDGYMVTGWFEYTYENDYSNPDGTVVKSNHTCWMYADSKGVLQTGWEKINGSWYYFSGFEMIDDCSYGIWDPETEEYTYYHFAPTGEMTTDWYFHENDGYGYWYYSDANGVVVDGWKQFGATWYYFDMGRMYANQWLYEASDVLDEEGNVIDVEHTRYYFDSEGRMVTGWYNRAGSNSNYGSWVYCDEYGKAYDGWLSSGGKWYYIEDGYMVTDMYICTDEYEDGTLYEYTDYGAYGTYSNYYVGRDGAMITGWYDNSYSSAISTNKAWKYANADGTIEAQWVKSGNDWYFVDSDGDMVRDGKYYAVAEDEKAPVREDYDSWEAYYDAQDAWERAHWYIFDASGKMVTNAWYKTTDTYGTTWLYADANGNGYTGWVQDAGKWYYCYEGEMLTNTYVPGGYYVGADGVWVQ